MKDFKFGNFIYNLRKRNGISQMELAELLGGTNKAVSKWENGRAKPKTEILQRMAAYFKISIEELLMMKGEKKMEISKRIPSSFCA